jgi:hypothetical protein
MILVQTNKNLVQKQNLISIRKKKNYNIEHQIPPINLF